MIRLLILLLLTSGTVFAQQNKKQKETPTVKESVEELKQSVKAIGNLFKKKNKSATDSTKHASSPETSNLDNSIPVASPSDSMIDASIEKEVLSYLIDLLKEDKPKYSFEKNSTYFDLQFDFGDGIRSSYYFSKYKKDNALGDLTGDGLDDLVLQVFSNSGGNSEYLDLYIFVQTGDKPVLKKVIPSSDDALKGCEIGQFIPQKIENGLLIGESQCFTENDPRCCPSIKFKRKLRWENNGFRKVD